MYLYSSTSAFILSYSLRYIEMSSCKERQRKHCAKVRQNKDLYLAQLEKDRKPKALQREKARAQMSESQLQEHRAQERARVRKYKEKK